MSVALPIDAGIVPRSDSIVHGVVAVNDYGFAHCTAVCTCGWTGRRRYLKAGAEQDAWMHSIHEKCVVSVPLVIPAIAT
jgi:hypothetical protein